MSTQIIKTETHPANTNLMDAHRQWANRPADERFHSLEEALGHLTSLRKRSATKGVLASQLNVVPYEDGLALVGSNGNPAALTHWSFGQVAGLAGRRAPWLTQLEPELVARVVHDGFQKRESDEQLQVLLTRPEAGGLPQVRALNGPQYSRYWDEQVLRFGIQLQQNGWKIPDNRRPDGTTGPEVYVGDRDSFLLIADPDRRIADGSEQGLYKALWISNSEVGARSLSMWAGFLRHICGNWILWGVSKSISVRLRHVGTLNDKAHYELGRILTEWGGESPRQIEQAIEGFQTVRVGQTFEEMLAAVKTKGLASEKATRQAYALAEANPVDGDPLSAWGLAQGFTRLSQDKASGFTGDRWELDQVAGKILQASW